MLKKIIILLTYLCFSFVSWADELKLNEDAPETYIVEKGDTLWDISALFLEQPWLWPQLWRLNPEIDNPHLIYPGDVLTLVYDEEGEPMLVVDEPEPEPEPVIVQVREKPTIKLSPKGYKQAKETPISTLPLSVIAPYLHYDNMFTSEQLDKFPYVIGSEHGYKSNIDGFKVYVKGDLKVASTYAIYQKEQAVIDPETEEFLGYSVKLLGTAQALTTGDVVDKVPATLYMNSAKKEIRSGSYVVPVNEGQLLPAYYTMKAADESIRGLILHSALGEREFGKYTVIMINRGHDDLVQLGDVLAIKRRSPSVIETADGPKYMHDVSRWAHISHDEEGDYKMPEETIGQMMVFKVYEKTSMALIVTAEKAIRIKDIVSAP